MYNLETQAKVAQWRVKALANTLTQEEMVEVVRHLTAGRKSAAAASSTSKTKRVASAKIDALNGDDLLDEMLT